MIELFFVLSTSILIMSSIKVIGLMVRVDINLPSIITANVSPENGIFLYPSILFQVWYWTNALSILA